jgi:hypothetical protein
MWSISKAFADSIRVFPSYDPDDRNNVGYDYGRVQYFPDFDPDGDRQVFSGDGRGGSQAGAEKDIALISMRQPLGDTFGTFGIDWGFNGGPVNVLGYPGKYGRNLMHDTGTVWKGGVDDNYLFRSDLEINSGNSGGPIYYTTAKGPYVVGLVSTGAAAVDVGGHRHWLEDAMRANDSLMGGGRPGYVVDIARLYEAAFDRRFDTQGLNFWIDRFEAGQTMRGLAASFLDSVEFTRRFGDDDMMSNAQFASRLYANVLDRAPDQAGLNFWVTTMARGASRETVLIEFAGSAENVRATGYLDGLRDLGNGFWSL